MDLGKTVLILGIVLVVIGLLLQFAPALHLGRLPGDFSFGGSGWRVYVPVGTSILVSLFLTLAFAVVGSLARH